MVDLSQAQSKLVLGGLAALQSYKDVFSLDEYP